MGENIFDQILSHFLFVALSLYLDRSVGISRRQSERFFPKQKQRTEAYEYLINRIERSPKKKKNFDLMTCFDTLALS